MLRFNLFFAFLALIGSESVLAQVATKSYPPPIQANIAEAKKECLSVGGKSMSVSAEAVMTADVSGDGSSDYFVDWGQFQCNGAASLWCGTAGCPVVAFVAGAD